jgi:dinuclear metal center YbgI/SA1388 family protein
LLRDVLSIGKINDVSCNGLQVQGTSNVHRVGLAVDACMATYRLATEKACDFILVHHGIIWGGIQSISGPLHTQIRYLIQNDLNLFAAHLPLDLHPTLGNNASLASEIGLKNLIPFGNYKGTLIGFEGTFPRAIRRDTIVDTLSRALDAKCTVLPFGNERIKRAAIISGGGAGELPEAITKGIDCYITGESSHENYHAALEAGINVIYAGHYHTETGGVQHIGELINGTFGLETVFLDIPTPL